MSHIQALEATGTLMCFEICQKLRFSRRLPYTNTTEYMLSVGSASFYFWLNFIDFPVFNKSEIQGLTSEFIHSIQMI